MKKKKKNAFDAFEEGEPLKLKHLVLYIKIFMYVILSIFAIWLFVYAAGAIYSTVSYYLNTIENVKADDVTITYVSMVNSYEKDYVLELIDKYDTSKGEFIFFEIIIPSLVSVAFLAIFSGICEKILKFIRKVKTDKDIFTEDNLKKFKKYRILVIAICLLLFFSDVVTSGMTIVLLELGYEIILYLLNHIVKQKKKEVKEV